MIHAKKSLGQNFLSDTETINRIAETADASLPVLEVGPGKGSLTGTLLSQGCTVTAIEKDDRLIDGLHTMFRDEIYAGQLRIVHADALEISPEQLGFTNKSYQIVANLPYYITGIFLRTVLEQACRPTMITLMLQQEVVDRIVTDDKESILSISVKAFGTAQKICNVPRILFDPTPNVDSAVVSISNISDIRFTQSGLSCDDFFSVVRLGFSSKRKMLKNNLSPLLEKQNTSFEDIAHRIGLSPQSRAENVSIDQWFFLARELTN